MDVSKFILPIREGTNEVGNLIPRTSEKEKVYRHFFLKNKNVRKS